MGTLPKIESVLLEIHQSLGGNTSYSTVQKNKFATGKISISKQSDMMKKIILSIFEKLNVRPESFDATWQSLTNIANAYKGLELKTWTFNANQKQINWMLLSHFLVPGLARFSAFQAIESPFDKGMSGGRFWYLPEVVESDGNKKLILPVPQVIDWLTDLLGTEVDSVANHSLNIDIQNLRRSLYNWKNGANTIRYSTIYEYFPDGLSLDFEGAFILDKTLNLDEKFNKALAFINKKELNAQKLKFEIPLSEELLTDILQGNVNEDEKIRLIECLLDRYSAPSIDLIRQRLVFASVVQDIYHRLVKSLCPDVDKYCIDPQQNKVLQLFALYKVVYNLTIEAWRNCRDKGEFAEDIWFEAHLPESDKQSLFLSILPSAKETGIDELAAYLSYSFRTNVSNVLDDVIGHAQESCVEVFERTIRKRYNFDEEQTKIQELKSRMQRSSPWRALQNEQNYWVVSDIAQSPELHICLKEMAAKRMRELANTPIEKILVVIPELAYYLNGESKNRPKDCKNKVDALITEAEKSEGYDLWKFAILQYKAKHLLAQNNFAEASEYFRDALEDSFKGSYGLMTGEIARDCLAVAVANQKLITNNHEKYYREMLSGGMIESDQIPSIEEVARWAYSYFWEDLYKPYPGIKPQQPLSQTLVKPALDKLFPLLEQNNLAGLKDWLNSNKTLFKSNLPDVEGNSMLMLMLKLFLKAQKVMDTKILEVWETLLKDIFEKYPKQLNIVDLKGQTPLMLAVEARETMLVEQMLLVGADANIQNYQGMTALHTACKIRTPKIFDAFCIESSDWNVATVDGRLPLHTACWSGNIYAVKKLVELVSEQLWEKDHTGLTPLELVEYLIENPEARQMLEQQSRRNGYSCGTQQELEKILAVLEQSLSMNN
ncbi:ankyrin repeat domain-containing protein [Acinetobacter tianfuensis]|uniref:ankyrin repeat domain-containing protein n=1 Tax=Acinetobacter tianfuensis TaxID=2419603 RepID=UPI00148D37EE|nr:ankyrin repeat domain-containing protein [Acinetobacter tianfuensis]